MKRLFLCLFLLLVGRLWAQWSPFGTGFSPNDFVIGMVDYQGSLLAYTYPSPVLYEWNGVGQWNTPMPPVPNAGGIHKLAVVDSVLWAATYATGTYNQVHRWDGSQWVQVGRSFRNWGAAGFPSMYDLVQYQDTLYVCGDFARYDTDTVNGIAKLVDSIWVKVGEGLTGGMSPTASLKYPHQMLVFNNELVVVGNFRYAGGQEVNGIARWDGTQWRGFGTGFNRAAYGACVHNGELYVGGEFTQADGNPVKRIAKWDGNAWVDPGIGVAYQNLPGVTSFVHTLVSHQGRLVVAGGFNRIYLNGTALTGMGTFIWDGTNVDRMNGGVVGDAEAIYPYQTGLLIGGDFTQVGGGVSADHVGYYDFITGAVAPAPNRATVYPTTFRDQLLVQVPGLDAAELQYEVVDLSGQVVARGNVSDAIRLGHLPPGWYLVRVLENGQAIVTAKVRRVE